MKFGAIKEELVFSVENGAPVYRVKLPVWGEFLFKFTGRWTFFCLCLMALLVPFNVVFLKWAAVSGFGMLCARKIIEAGIGKKPLWRGNPLNGAVGTFVIAMGASTIFSENMYDSSQIFSERIIPYAIIFLMAKETITTRKRLFGFLGVMGLVAFVVGFDAVWQYFTGRDLFFGYSMDSNYDVGGVAITGPFGRHSFLSGYLEMVVPLFVFCSFFTRPWYARALIFATTILLIFSWMYVFQRGMVLSVTISLFAVLFLYKKRYSYMFLSIILAAFFLLPSLMHKRIVDTFQPGGDNGRFQLWQQALELFVRNPLTGTGLGGYERYSNSLGLPDIHVHSTYFELLAEAGIVGLGAFLFLIFVFFRHQAGAFKNLCRDYRQRITCAGFTALCVSSLISGLFTTNIVVGIACSAMFWMSLAVATGIPYIPLSEDQRFS